MVYAAMAYRAKMSAMRMPQSARRTSGCLPGVWWSLIVRASQPTAKSHTGRRAPSPVFTAPYAVAVVALAEGPRLLSNVEPWQDAAIGAAVRVHWRPLADGRHLPVFSLR